MSHRVDRGNRTRIFDDTFETRNLAAYSSEIKPLSWVKKIEHFFSAVMISD